MAVLGDLLFYSGFRRAGLSDVLRHNESEIVSGLVDGLSDHAFSTKSDDELVAEVIERCTVEPLELELERAKGDAQEISIQVQEVFGDTATVKGLRIVKEIPFSGDAQLFQLQPDTFDLNPPRGTIQGKKLLVGMEVRESQSEEAIRYIEETVASVQTCISRQATAIAQSNARLAAAAHPLIQRRRARLGKASDIAKRLSGG